ncbi:PAS domain S-box-containing protein/HDIG domain-containing protein [Trichlorobacter thiogenes]|uniref:PAS domain S-box-containing protein/HDIG domain-containing protein n=1 Tax=Trichlorobacter thiogenes TaxID=115783 RepID=A0A1T4LTE6_9BACT|nr:HD domain-containing phosphohydrolase [Trichlorobacter thiogenes]SJZ57808.1 PAS domain S-box-containing protein/HDIG domain-containing protein [Trichlorobacter thiogenes]
MAVKNTINPVETEATLGVNQRNLLKLVKSSPLGMIAIDPQGLILLWNLAAEEITGWSEQEVLGQDFRLLVDAWLVYELEEVHKRILNSEVIHSLPITITRKDGRMIIISYSSAPVFDDDRIIAAIAVIYDVTEKINMEMALRNSLEKMSRVVDETVTALATAIGKRDPYTAGHQQRVAQLACAIAEEMGGFDDDRLKGLRMAATIHDIGKLYVPAEILAKPGQLSGPEFALIKTHPQAGFDILGEVEFPWPIASIVQQHHERLDGSGYPYGLTGDNILMEARIIGVADVVEAISSHRPYRPSKGIEAALDEINEGRGDIYDANVVDACLALFCNGYILLEA